ncbi:MAG: 2-oxo acid dehydrogenase subunit E2 [Lachnospiraceae bacterium]|nr:2-oxo acid dehydrogenase subunit E2 [Lachnospiraceae bacterium]
MGRRDGVRLKNVDSMHTIMPLMYPNRCDNEAFITEVIDITNINRYLEKKNASDPVYKYKLFQVVVVTMLKVLTLRPKMNRFITRMRLYQRNEVSAAFTIKKIFADESDEALASIHAKPDDTMDSIHDQIYKQVSFCRSDSKDPSTQSMDTLNKLPDWLLQFVGFIARIADRHGWMPKSVIETDPYQHSIVLTNLGSIKLHAGYHHLTNWGTCSVFVVIGDIKKRKFMDEEGNETIKDSVEINLIIDERIADGYYYSRTVQLFKKLLENPELLDRPLSEEVDY